LLLAFFIAVDGASATAAFRFERLAGTDRHDTARVVAESTFPVSATDAVLVRGDDFPDALAGAYVAGGGGPVLLTDRDSLPAATRTALQRLRTKNVIILGGPAAVSPTVEAEVERLGITTERLAGADRFETARLCAKRFAPTTIGTVDGRRSAIVVSGRNFPDALAAGPLAYAVSLPVLLTETDTLPSPTRAALSELGIQRAIVLGGAAAVGSSAAKELEDMGLTVTRISGADRTETATALADFVFDPARKLALGSLSVTFDDTHVNLVGGEAFADALAGGPHAGEDLAPILLTISPSELSEHTRRWLARRSSRLQDGHIFGGEASVNARVAAEATAAAKG
jgi:putative cell wall-binding protein